MYIRQIGSFSRRTGQVEEEDGVEALGARTPAAACEMSLLVPTTNASTRGR